MSHKPDYYATLVDSTKNTPDWVKLKYGPMDEFPVFIFGTLEKFRVNNKKLEDCKYYGKARTFTESFVAKQPPINQHSLLGDPFVFCTAGVSQKLIEQEGLQPIFESSTSRALEGEIYGVPLRKLAELDSHYQNQDGSERIKVWCRLLDPCQEGASVEAYLWTVDLDYFLDIYTPDINLRDCNTIGYRSPHTDKYTHNYKF